jgi:nitronate monooxygenase
VRGAAGVQIGTAYLFYPEAAISPLYRDALQQARADTTVLTSLLSERPARTLSNRLTRELRPLHGMTPAYPTPMLAALAELQGSREFSPRWAGQATPLGREMPAGRGADPRACGGGIEAVSPARRLTCPRAW